MTAGERSPTNTKGPSVLIVEDEQAIRKLMTTVLGMEHYDIHEASTAAEALQIAKDVHLDLLIADLTLPDLPGTDLASQLTQHQPHLGVLMISGYEAPEAERLLQANPQARFLSKPFQLPMLLAIVKELTAPRT